MVVLNWFLFLVLAVVFVYTPYERGLFFDPDFYVWEIIIGISFVVYVLLLFWKKRDAIEGSVFVLFVLPFLFVITMPIAETPNGNWEQLFRWMTYACFFVLLFHLKRQDERIAQLMPYLFYLVGMWIVCFGLLALWGKVEFRDAMLGNRMSSFFQYPNTFATVISAMWLYGLVMLTNKKLPYWAVLFCSLPLTAFAIAFLHSYSRGTWLFFPLAWLLGLFVLKADKQLQYIVYTLISTVVGLVVFKGMLNPEITVTSEVNRFILATVITIVLILVIHCLVRKGVLQKLEGMNWLRFWLPILSITAFVALLLDLSNKGKIFSVLPDSIQGRVASIDLTSYKSLLELGGGRVLFYEQAIDMSKDAPLFGFGGDGWRMLFTKYQSAPFIARETHNGYLTWVLDVGWIGLLLIGAIFAISIFNLFKNMNMQENDENKVKLLALIPAFAMLLLHSIVDFDWSFGTVLLIIVWMLVMGLPTTTPFIKLEKFRFLLKKIIVPVVVLFVFVSTVYTVKFQLAYQKVSAEGKVSLEEAKNIYLTAKRYNPYNTDYYMNLANVYFNAYSKNKNEAWKKEIIELLKQAEELEPHNPTLLANIANMYNRFGDSASAIAYFDKALENDRFNKDFYYAAIGLRVQNALNGFNENKEKAAELGAEAVEVYETYMGLLAGIQGKSIPDSRNFTINPTAHYLAAEVYSLTGQFDKIIPALDKVAFKVGEKKDFYFRSNALRVLALEKQGKKAEADQLKATIVKSYPEFAGYVGNYSGRFK